MTQNKGEPMLDVELDLKTDQVVVSVGEWETLALNIDQAKILSEALPGAIEFLANVREDEDDRMFDDDSLGMWEECYASELMNF
jgi:hypothetical protein